MSRLVLRGLGQVGDLVGPSAIAIDDGTIIAVDDPAHDGGGAGRVLDAGGLAAVPGFIELQVNGAAGSDFTSEPEAMWRVGPLLARHGVTAFLPTIITAPRGTVDAALAAWRGGAPEAGAPVPLGLHVEGPYLAMARRGAHDADLLRPPEPAEMDRWLTGGGLRMLTLAPELPGGIKAVERLAAAGVVPAVGHTDADAATVRRAIEAGARFATHLFNAMPPLGHRQPGAVGAVLDDPRVAIGIIADGHHLDPIVVRFVSRVGDERVVLVSDAIAALGLPDGTHRLGHRRVEVRGGTARLKDGTLAGSVVGLDECIRTFAATTGSVALAIRAATSAPARVLGIDDRRGHLRPGARADVTLLDGELMVRATLVGGEIAYADEAIGW